ncbi:transposable element Tcb2 transposase [Trichonephila clavipes]|nr:transposable element Tcb2 transposase [Trichonephila clavipes]
MVASPLTGGKDLYIIRDGPLTARRYGDKILRSIVVPYATAIGDDFLLMDDNCRPHCANLVEDFLFEEGIVRMEWPLRFPDMNPIEHVWDTLGRRVAGRQPPPQTLQELERALLEEWDRIPQLVINSRIDSMPQGRVQLKMSRHPTPKITPQRYLQTSKQIIPTRETDVPVRGLILILKLPSK